MEILQLSFVACTLISITVATEVFRQTGSSLQLDIQKHGHMFEDLFWKCNKTKHIIIYSISSKSFDRYVDNVEFDDKTYSLTLKNLKKTDSGLYEATASGDKNIIIAEYNLSVLDPVEAPVLFQQLNRDTCNITLFCKIHHLYINSGCSIESCEEKTVTSPGGVALHLSVNNGSIICNHSNPVSWKTDELKLEELCTNDGSVLLSAGVSVCLLKAVLYIITLILMFSAVITVHIKERLTKSS